MPILTEANQPRKRRASVWALILALLLLPPVGTFGWSCYQPVKFVGGGVWVAFGRYPSDYDPVPELKMVCRGWGAFRLPGWPKGDWYVWGWI